MRLIPTPTAVEIATATKSQLIAWLRWNDGNGEYPSSMSKTDALAAAIYQASGGFIHYNDQIG